MRNPPWPGSARSNARSARHAPGRCGIGAPIAAASWWPGHDGRPRCSRGIRLRPNASKAPPVVSTRDSDSALWAGRVTEGIDAHAEQPDAPVQVDPLQTPSGGSADREGIIRRRIERLGARDGAEILETQLQPDRAA